MNLEIYNSQLQKKINNLKEQNITLFNFNHVDY